MEIGAALAFAVSFIAPQLAQFMLVTIPAWMMVAITGAAGAHLSNQNNSIFLEFVVVYI